MLGDLLKESKYRILLKLVTNFSHYHTMFTDHDVFQKKFTRKSVGK